MLLFVCFGFQLKQQSDKVHINITQYKSQLTEEIKVCRT